MGHQVIAVDQNRMDIGGLGGNTDGHAAAFAGCGGQGVVVDFLNEVGAESVNLLRRRAHF